MSIKWIQRSELGKIIDEMVGKLNAKPDAIVTAAVAKVTDQIAAANSAMDARLTAIEAAIAQSHDAEKTPRTAPQAVTDGIVAAVRQVTEATLAPVSAMLADISAKSNTGEKLDKVLHQLGDMAQRLEAATKVSEAATKVNERLGVDSRVFARQDKAIDELSGRMDAAEQKRAKAERSR